LAEAAARHANIFQSLEERTVGFDDWARIDEQFAPGQ
jgi:hypothetical protein